MSKNILKIGVGVGVMIYRNGQVLLGLRNFDPKRAGSELGGAGTWTMPGGKVEYKETLEDASKREVFEETGIKINKNNLKLISVKDDIFNKTHFVTIGFLLTKIKGMPRVKEPREITEWRWFPINNLPKNIYFPSKEIIKSYQTKRLYK